MKPFTIRRSTKKDLDLLPYLEERADRSYADMERFAPMFKRQGLTIEQCHNLPPSTQIWIAETDIPVGFVFTRNIDDMMYFGQLSVVPEAQEHGIGSALLNVAVEAARVQQKPGLVLITYADVAFNGPFYAKRGFRALNAKEMGPQLKELAIADEREWGCFSPRVIMGRFFSEPKGQDLLNSSNSV